MPESKRKQWRIVRWGKRILKWILYGTLIYIGILLIGLIPVNNSFVPADGGITLYVVSNEVHADIIVPVKTDIIDWAEEFSGATFGSDVTALSHVAFGWGDKGFFLETETWDDFKLSIAANALLLPSESCIHVSFTNPTYFKDAASVTVSESQYQKLVDHIERSFNADSNQQSVQIPDRSYSSNDAFFEANGRYHLLNTCNSWVGRGLKSAEVRVPWLSPLPKTPMLYFE